MSKTTCIIIDDEQLAIDTLEWQIKEFCKELEIKASFTDPTAAIDYLDNNTVDLCFLDIDMPEMSGFTFLTHWDGDPPFAFIFTTAYSQYAIEAFKVSAFHYLLKPIDEDDLVSTIEKYRKQSQTKSVRGQLEIMMEQLQKPKSYASRIALPTIEGIHMVNVIDIIRLEADNNYTTIYTSDECLIVSRTLKDIDALLDPKRFVRIHQSHTIDIQKVKLYQRGRGGSVILIDGTTLPVSKGKKERLLEGLGL